MSRFDESLFSRIAVLSNYVAKEDLEACLEIQRTRGSEEHIGHVLREQGFLTEEQFQRISDIRRKKVRRLLRNRESTTEVDRECAKVLLSERLMTLDELEELVLEQQHLRAFNLHFSLIEVLVSRRRLDLPTAKRVLALQGRSLLRCPACDVQYQVADPGKKDADHRCPRCESALSEPVYLDPLMVEGKVEAAVPDSVRG